ncbi:hypothetical protein FA10DRAFT_295846 [Acaromyces ingoldii]|uniref:Hydrophobin n=1 Tax=Acaromyces ingoldii TaxID=215250 RepID=A0A316YI36_9BASI|nr:hypothetical protein FA10DRAFT_295846 [Acaromyces ingoldii]PWN88288.1 hypothetical protein FA10DRAFT_295846 [Acaromyces ingoldii]
MIALKLMLVLFALVTLSFVSVSAADNIFICESGSSNVTCCASADEVELIQKHKCTDQNMACTAAVQIKQGKCNNRLWSDPNKLSELHCTPTINGQPLAGSKEFKCCGKNTELAQYNANCTIVGDCPADGLNRCAIDKTKWYRLDLLFDHYL